MVLIAGTLLLGIVVGFAMGGSLRRLGDVHFRWWGLAFLGLALQVAPVPSRPGNGDHLVAVGLLVASYVVLLVFVVVGMAATIVGTRSMGGLWLQAHTRHARLAHLEAVRVRPVAHADGRPG